MEILIIIVLSFFAGGFLIALAAGLWSRRKTLPCPAWLGWLVELDNPLLRNNRASVILSRLELKEGMHVLDLGCGPGRVTIPLARAVGERGRVTAFDLQAGMLARVAEKAAAEGLANIEPVQGAAGEGLLGRERYDAAVMVTVLGEIPDQLGALREVCESLKPDGVLVVTEVIADPHFVAREQVSALARAAGFEEDGFFGWRWDYSMRFRKEL